MFFKIENYGNLKNFASHIHVLYREVPFILNITACPEVRQGNPRAFEATKLQTPPPTNRAKPKNIDITKESISALWNNNGYV